MSWATLSRATSFYSSLKRPPVAELDGDEKSSPTEPTLPGEFVQPKPIPVEDDAHALIAVMGATGSGKSTLINRLSGSDFKVGGDLESCTQQVEFSKPFLLNRRWVTMIDTPGFDDSKMSDKDVLNLIAASLASSYRSGKKLTGIIYLHRICDIRMTGISIRNFKMFRQLCGEQSLKNVILATNMWEREDAQVGQQRESQLANEDQYFKPVLAKGAQLVRLYNTRESAQALVKRLVDAVPIALLIQEELVDDAKTILQTSAGAALVKEFEAAMKERLSELEQTMKDAFEEKDAETRRELLEEQSRLQREIGRLQVESQSLATDYGRKLAYFEDLMRQRSEEEQRLQNKIAELTGQLQQSSGDTAHLREEIERLKRRKGKGGCCIQ